MTATDARVWVTWITAFGQGVDHAVTDDEVNARRAEHPGEYRAVCGAAFLPAAMESAPRPPCPACLRFLRTRANLSGPEQRLGSPRRRRRHGQPGWWARVMCRAWAGRSR